MSEWVSLTACSVRSSRGWEEVVWRLYSGTAVWDIWGWGPAGPACCSKTVGCYNCSVLDEESKPCRDRKHTFTPVLLNSRHHLIMSISPTWEVCWIYETRSLIFQCIFHTNTRFPPSTEKTVVHTNYDTKACEMTVTDLWCIPHPEEEIQRVLYGPHGKCFLSARQVDGQIIELFTLHHHLSTAVQHKNKSISTLH